MAFSNRWVIKQNYLFYFAEVVVTGHFKNYVQRLGTKHLYITILKAYEQMVAVVFAHTYKRYFVVESSGFR